MSRLRVTLARSDPDREMQRHLNAAARSLQAALDVCVRTARTGGAEGSDPSDARRARKYADVIRRARDAVGSVGHLGSVVDMGDPDLVHESARRPPPVKVPVPAPSVESDGG